MNDTGGMTVLSDSDRRALEQMLSTFPSLEAWRARSRSVEEPQRGSEAALDDAIWRWMPPSEIARQSLVAATQHLNLARTAIEAKDIYPSSHFTVLRGGLVGASQALWILGPDDRVERQQRALRVIDEWYRRALQHAAEYLPLIDDSADRQEMQQGIAHMRGRRDDARRLWRDTSTLSDKQTLELTDVITWSASEVMKDPLRAALVKPLWQQLSGDAHALGWAVLTRSSLVERQAGGMAVFAAGGDLRRISQAFTLSYRILKAGWSLFDRRCEGP